MFVVFETKLVESGVGTHAFVDLHYKSFLIRRISKNTPYSYRSCEATDEKSQHATTEIQFDGLRSTSGS
jgi:hypothetical protein